MAHPLETLRTVFPLQVPGPAARVAHVLQQLRTFGRLPAQHREQLLSRQLAHLLRHAKKNSPFWRERLPESKKLTSVADMLGNIEPLTRHDLQKDFERISAEFPERAELEIGVVSTSGSTGTPIRVERVVELYFPLYHAVTLLTAMWHGMDQTKPVGVLASKLVDSDRAPLGIPFLWFGPVAAGFARSTKDREAAELYDYCAGKNPSYLQCGPFIAYSLARHAIESGRRDLAPALVQTTGSVVTEDLRETVRIGLGAKVVDRYSCEETGYIAVQCPKYDHFHVMSPVNYVEIVDDKGAPCPVGVPGRVLLTSMHSYAMPLLRYEIGDMAEWGDPCDCGSALPVIKRVWGRTRHHITTPDGRKTHARIYARDFQNIPGLLAYRFVLHRNETVVAQLRVETPSSLIASAVTEKVQAALSYPYPVQIRYVDQIDWGNHSKQEYFGVSDAPA